MIEKHIIPHDDYVKRCADTLAHIAIAQEELREASHEFEDEATAGAYIHMMQQVGLLLSQGTIAAVNMNKMAHDNQPYDIGELLDIMQQKAQKSNQRILDKRQKDFVANGCELDASQSASAIIRQMTQHVLRNVPEDIQLQTISTSLKKKDADGNAIKPETLALAMYLKQHILQDARFDEIQRTLIESYGKSVAIDVEKISEHTATLDRMCDQVFTDLAECPALKKYVAMHAAAAKELMREDMLRTSLQMASYQQEEEVSIHQVEYSHAVLEQFAVNCAAAQRYLSVLSDSKEDATSAYCRDMLAYFHKIGERLMGNFEERCGLASDKAAEVDISFLRAKNASKNLFHILTKDIPQDILEFEIAPAVIDLAAKGKYEDSAKVAGYVNTLLGLCDASALEVGVAPTIRSVWQDLAKVHAQFMLLQHIQHENADNPFVDGEKLKTMDIEAEEARITKQQSRLIPLLLGVKSQTLCDAVLEGFAHEIECRCGYIDVGQDMHWQGQQVEPVVENLRSQIAECEKNAQDILDKERPQWLQHIISGTGRGGASAALS